MISEKTFHRALLEFNNHPEKMKRYLNDKRMTILEKNIINAYLLIRKNKNKDVIQIFTKKNDEGSAFVESQKHYVLGSAYNNLCQFTQAQIHFKNAIKLLEACPNVSSRFNYVASFNLFWVN